MAIFEPMLGNYNGHPELETCTYVLAEVGAVKKGVMERKEKRDRE